MELQLDRICKKCLVMLLVSVVCWAQDGVRQPAKIVGQNEEESIIYNPGVKDITLICKAEGTEPIDYEWKKDGELLDFTGNVKPPHDNAGSFIIEKANRENVGFYQCFARNSWGTDMTYGVDLEVTRLDYYPPTSPVLIPVKEFEGAVLPSEFKPDSSNPPVPPEGLEWMTVLKIGNEDKIQVVPDRRRHFDAAGNMYFSYVKMSDQAADRKYILAVRNSEMGTTQEGSDSILDIQAAEDKKYRPVVLSPKAGDAPVMALTGGTARLNCFFAAYPEPTSVNWDYLRLEDRSRVHETKFGYELVINDVRDEDEGDFTCQAANSEGSSDRVTVSLNVESKPSFVDDNYPKDVTATEGESISFLCKVKAEPEAPIEWFVNGQKLNVDNPGPDREVKDGNFTIRKLCKQCDDGRTDLMVVQCLASNIHGSAYASGFLNVIEDTIITEEPTDIVLEPKKDMVATYTCKATHDPSTKLDIFWKKKDLRLYPNVDPRQIITDLKNPDGSLSGSQLVINLTDSTEDEQRDYISEEYKCISRSVDPSNAAIIYSTKTAVFALIVQGVEPSAPPVVEAGIGDLWWVFVIIAVVLLLFISCLCLVMHIQRNKGEDYPVDEKERGAGRDPEKELADAGFQDYQRPVDHDPIKGSRASLASSGDYHFDDDDSLGEYGDEGRFNEDGSFIGRYKPENKYGRDSNA